MGRLLVDTVRSLHDLRSAAFPRKKKHYRSYVGPGSVCKHVPIVEKLLGHQLRLFVACASLMGKTCIRVYEQAHPIVMKKSHH